MASTSMQREILSLPSNCIRRWTYDVFLSFRGEDTRKNFTSHLFAALDQKGIFTFKDNLRLQKGKLILSELFKAIEESRFSVIVFSKNYASSKWCLDELVKILECMKVTGQRVLPVFYNVSPSEIRNQTGSVEQAFMKYEKLFMEDIEKVQNWRAAMTEVANLSGWHLQDREESIVIQDIVNEISSQGSPASLSMTKKLVGIDSRMEQMELLLGTGQDDVRILGICGMGGIGKTTLARVVFDKKAYQFDGSIFLANVREVSMTQGLVSLQEQLIYKILNEKNINIGDVHEGSNFISRRLCNKKVLVILDDVDQLQQLQALVGEHDWFGLGSRIIVTTRDRHLLVSHGADNVYNVEGLKDDEAHKLFCWRAFRNDHPADGYFELSYHMVNYADGLPLALEVLGSFLFGRSKAEWKSALDRLKVVLDRKIFEILKISYDELQELEKKIFLDIACFFVGKNKDQVTEILDSCDFYPHIGFSVLIDKCIINISDNKLSMHDLIKDMGREVVRQECPNRAGQRSRLWLYKDIHRVLTNNEGTEAVEVIMVNSPTFEMTLDAKSFSRMSNLRLLRVRGVRLDRGLEYLSDELRLLKWHGYPLRSLPSNFQPEKLYKLNMRYSNIEQLWKGIKNMNQLKIIKLSHSKHLTRTPDFSAARNLERLVLDGCKSLSFLHPSIGLLRRLILFDLKDCERLRSLPTQIEWESLEVLILSGCAKLSNLQEIVGNVKHVLQLLLDGTSIEELPSSIQHLKRLITLNLKDCKKLVSLPSSIGDLRSLKVLNLNGCSKLEELPENLGHAAGLEYLDLGGTAICKPPSSIVLLKNLKELSFHGCKGQVQKSWSSLLRFPFFPRANLNSLGLLLPTLSGLNSLRRLDIGDCNIQEGVLPADLGCLPSLLYLNLSRNNFVSLPTSICQLSKLETLHIENCKRLQALPELPASVDRLFAHDCISLELSAHSCKDLELFAHSCLSLETISTSTIKYESTRKFYLSNCFKLTANQGNNSTTFTLLESLLQFLPKTKFQEFKRGVAYSKFDIVVPGSQVPEWFTYHSLGPSITALAPRHAGSKPGWGLSLCAAFSVHQCDSSSDHDDTKLVCHLMVDNSSKPDLSISFHSNSLTESDHLWLIYIPRCYCVSFRNNPDRIKASFSFDFGGSCISAEVKECGLRPVYNHDVEELIQASSSSEDLARNRLAVKSTVKRSPETDWPYLEPRPKRRR